MMTKDRRTGVLLHLKEPAAQEPAPDMAEKPEKQKTGALSEAAHVVLGYVGEHPEGIHGYHLGSILSRSPLRLPSLGLGQLYRLLHRLEKAGLVISRVEEESARLRYRFTITPRGEACFSKWLNTVPAVNGTTCDQVLDRLRFADRLPGAVLLRLIDEAERELERKAEELGEYELTSEGARMNRQYAPALRARLAADRGWLAEVRRLAEGALVSRSAQTPEDAERSRIEAKATGSF
jgi:DNA-binding PadR family transcriptional regulator